MWFDARRLLQPRDIQDPAIGALTEQGMAGFPLITPIVGEHPVTAIDDRRGFTAPSPLVMPFRGVGRLMPGTAWPQQGGSASAAPSE